MTDFTKNKQDLLDNGFTILDPIYTDEELNHSALKVQRFVLRGTESPSISFIRE